MDWLRSEDLKEEKNVTAPIVSIAGVALAGGMCHGHMREGALPQGFAPCSFPPALSNEIRYQTPRKRWT